MRKIWFVIMRLTRNVVSLVGRIFRYEITDERWFVFEQFIKFVLVGCSNAFITLLVYDGIVLTFGKEQYLVGETIGYIAGVINSFYFNRKFVFEPSSQTIFCTFSKMFICYCATYFLQTGLLILEVEMLAVTELIAPIIAIIVTTPVNFTINKLWSFKS